MNRPLTNEFSLALDDVVETERLGAALVSELHNGMVFFLQGEMGAGKTTLVRGLLRELGYQGAVKSPTYALLEEYSFTGLSIIHFDLYRLSDPEELDLIGFRDYFTGDNCCFIEWPERGEGHLPAADLEILLSHDGDARTATITALSEAGSESVNKLKIFDL